MSVSDAVELAPIEAGDAWNELPPEGPQVSALRWIGHMARKAVAIEIRVEMEAEREAPTGLYSLRLFLSGGRRIGWHHVRPEDLRDILREFSPR